jgi:hypothetical protein
LVLKRHTFYFWSLGWFLKGDEILLPLSRIQQNRGPRMKSWHISSLAESWVPGIVSW